MASEVYASLGVRKRRPQGEDCLKLRNSVRTIGTMFKLASSFPMCGESVSLSHLSISSPEIVPSYWHSRGESLRQEKLGK